MKDYKYMVFRTYSAKERPDRFQRSVFYGWTKNKNVLKAFLAQRSKNKYKVVKMSDAKVANYFSEDITDAESNIDIIKLKSATTKEEFSLFSTMREIHESEIKIQRMFHDLCSISNIKGDGDYLGIIMNLNDYYASALAFVGYRPPEIDVLYDSEDPHDSYNNLYSVEEQINDAYDGVMAYPFETLNSGLHVEGISVIEDVSSKVIYSLESFIRVMKDDL